MRESEALNQLDESRLWRAVLACAFEDAMCPNPRQVGESGGRVSVEEVAEARRFLLSPLDPWREDRHLVCLFADREVEVVEQRARKILNPIISREAEEESRYAETAEAARARLAWAEHLEMGGSAAARGPLRKRPIEMPARKPTQQQRPSAEHFMRWIVESEEGLSALGELDEAIAHAASLELAECERRTKRERMAQKRAATRGSRYMTTYTPAIAAE